MMMMMTMMMVMVMMMMIMAIDHSNAYVNDAGVVLPGLNAEAVKWGLAKGVDPNQESNMGTTPIQHMERHAVIKCQRDKETFKTIKELLQPSNDGRSQSQGKQKIQFLYLGFSFHLRLPNIFRSLTKLS